MSPSPQRTGVETCRSSRPRIIPGRDSECTVQIACQDVARRCLDQERTDDTSEMVRELREKTGAGMMVTEGACGSQRRDGSAIDSLRKKVAAAAKLHGVHGAACVDARGALVEVNCETDFVAKTDDSEIRAKS